MEICGDRCDPSQSPEDRVAALRIWHEGGQDGLGVGEIGAIDHTGHRRQGGRSWTPGQASGALTPRRARGYCG